MAISQRPDAAQDTQLRVLRAAAVHASEWRMDGVKFSSFLIADTAWSMLTLADVFLELNLSSASVLGGTALGDVALGDFALGI